MPSVDDIARTCACLHTRIAARAVTRAYDEALRPLGLKMTQFTLLAAISQGASGSVSALANELACERTTLTRNLRLLHEAGLIAPRRSKGRAAAYEVTLRGRHLVSKALPLWAAAQARIESTVGTHQWDALRGQLDQLRRAAEAAAA